LTLDDTMSRLSRYGLPVRSAALRLAETEVRGLEQRLWLDLSETWSRLLHFVLAANPRGASF
jgi:hypothetical protein